MSDTRQNGRIECINPILSVRDLAVSLDFYENVLGFRRADWVAEGAAFGSVSRDGCTIYLAQRAQGQPGTRVWVGVDGADEVFEEIRSRGARILQEPTNYSWAFEMKVEDPDGHVLRFGAEPKADRPLVDRT